MENSASTPSSFPSALTGLFCSPSSICTPKKILNLKMLEPYHFLSLLFNDQNLIIRDLRHLFRRFSNKVANARGAGKTFWHWSSSVDKKMSPNTRKVPSAWRRLPINPVVDLKGGWSLFNQPCQLCTATCESWLSPRTLCQSSSSGLLPPRFQMYPQL